MSFKIIHNDLTKMNTDAIVNAANSHLEMGGGVCGAIFEAAGAKLLQKECNIIGKCAVGDAVITKGYGLSAKYVIHAVGPIWRGGKSGEAELLASAYRKSLEIAKTYNLKSISYPLISSGIYGYPKEEALQIATSTIRDFLLHNEMDVYLVVFDRKAVALSKQLGVELNHYLDTYYEDAKESYARRLTSQTEDFQIYSDIEPIHDMLSELPIQNSEQRILDHPKNKRAVLNRSLEDFVNELDESFSEMLLRLIDEKGKTDVEVYKKANMDRKLFSKIRSNKGYNPKKSNVLSLAISLELSLNETVELLSKAGYALSTSHKFDVIIRYFIERKNYDIFEINEALFCYEQNLLGA